MSDGGLLIGTFERNLDRKKRGLGFFWKVGVSKSEQGTLGRIDLTKQAISKPYRAVSVAATWW